MPYILLVSLVLSNLTIKHYMIGVNKAYIRIFFLNKTYHYYEEYPYIDSECSIKI